MNCSINFSVKKRLDALLLKYGLIPPVDLKIHSDEFVMFRSVGGDSFGMDCWVYVSHRELLIIFFGNIQLGKNYSFLFVPILKGSEYKWFILIRERLRLRDLRERQQGNYSGVTRTSNEWVTSLEANNANQ